MRKIISKLSQEFIRLIRTAIINCIWHIRNVCVQHLCLAKLEHQLVRESILILHVTKMLDPGTQVVCG